MNTVRCNFCYFHNENTIIIHSRSKRERIDLYSFLWSSIGPIALAAYPIIQFNVSFVYQATKQHIALHSNNHGQHERVSSCNNSKWRLAVGAPFCEERTPYELRAPQAFSILYLGQQCRNAKMAFSRSILREQRTCNCTKYDIACFSVQLIYRKNACAT